MYIRKLTLYFYQYFEPDVISYTFMYSPVLKYVKYLVDKTPCTIRDSDYIASHTNLHKIQNICST